MSKPVTPLLAADCVVFDEDGLVLLIRRSNSPFKGELALPGGFVEIGETVEAAARRELREETAIDAANLDLVGVYSDPRRDPRGHVCAVAFMTEIPHANATASDDAVSVEWVDSTARTTLAFDHAQIIADARAKRLQRSV